HTRWPRDWSSDVCSSDLPISASDVKRLRDDTGAGMMDCKRALAEARGDVTAAKDLLRTWGLAGVEKRKARAASDGLVVSYLHERSEERRVGKARGARWPP